VFIDCKILGYLLELYNLFYKLITVEKILKVIQDLVKDPVTKLFANFKEVLVIKTDDLKPTKLLTHRKFLNRDPPLLNKGLIDCQRYRPSH